MYCAVIQFYAQQYAIPICVIVHVTRFKSSTIKGEL
jgi:hypothetical protein